MIHASLYCAGVFRFNQFNDYSRKTKRIRSLMISRHARHKEVRYHRFRMKIDFNNATPNDICVVFSEVVEDVGIAQAIIAAVGRGAKK